VGHRVFQDKSGGTVAASGLRVKGPKTLSPYNLSDF